MVSLSLSRVICFYTVSALTLSAQLRPLDPAPSRFHSGTELAASVPQLSGTQVSLPPDQRGDIFMARKMFREAIEAYKEGPPDSPYYANKIGIAYQQLQEPLLARKQYERAVKLKPDYAEAINNLGTIFYAQKNFRRATTYYKRALRIQPKSASIMSNLGTAYFARKHYKECSELYEKALAIDPEIFERKGMAGVLLQERSVEERAKFHYYMAKMYAKANQNDRALQYLRKALEEGFKDKKKIGQESEFAGLKELPEFQEILTLEPRVL